MQRFGCVFIAFVIKSKRVTLSAKYLNKYTKVLKIAVLKRVGESNHTDGEELRLLDKHETFLLVL